VTFNRSYQKGDDTQYASSFGPFDLRNVVRCCADAYTYIAKRMKEDRADNERDEAEAARNLSTTLRHSPIEFSEHLLSWGPPGAG
jgi:hypothetical protein